MNDAKRQLLDAARSGGSAAVRELQANGGPRETVTVRTTMSADLMQYRLTDNNYHSVRIVSAGDGQMTLSAPVGYRLRSIMTEFFGLRLA